MLGVQLLAAAAACHKKAGRRQGHQLLRRSQTRRIN